MKRDRSDEEQNANEDEQLSEDDFGPRMENLGPKPKKQKKHKRVKFEKFYLQVCTPFLATHQPLVPPLCRYVRKELHAQKATVTHHRCTHHRFHYHSLCGWPRKVLEETT